ncbi:MAG: hypothetical protein ACREUW_10760 [Burkholderiales bacterium]
MRIITAVLLSLSLIGPAAAATVEDDVNRYIAIFNGDKSQHAEAGESLGWMGLSDPRLFDLLERRALEDYQAARTDRRERTRVAWYVRALGFSGQPKYLPTLAILQKDQSYSNYSRTAQEQRPFYQAANPVISNRATFDPQYTDEVNRVRNMLNAKDPQVWKLGAKRVYFQNKDTVLLDLLAEKIKATYRTRYASFEDVDVVDWMVKALGHARQEKYKPLLQEVATNAEDPRVRDYANRALGQR